VRLREKLIEFQEAALGGNPQVREKLHVDAGED